MNKNNYLFTSESVGEGHPDKVADQISDAILDHFLAFDPKAHVACETMVTTGQVIIAGEVTSTHYVDLPDVARRVIKNIGYNNSELKFDADSCGILTALHEQSPDINQGVDRTDGDQGAGDQGMMFGYACNETTDLMPLTIDLAHKLMRTLADIRKGSDLMPYLRPDAKAQVTVEYDGDTHRPVRIAAIVVSTQHDDTVTQEQIKEDVKNILIPRALKDYSPEIRAMYRPDDAEDKTDLFVNPTGMFNIGGPAGDTGLTGRKIIVDTYGGRGAHGGGAFSGKDPSKVDRSAAYACRHIAKNAVAAGVADEMLVQVAYAIGVAQPVSFCVNTYGTSHVQLSDQQIAAELCKHFRLKPAEIIQDLKLLQPIYSVTASYGHMGRKHELCDVEFKSHNHDVPDKSMKLELFTWENLDKVDELKAAFGLS